MVVLRKKGAVPQGSWRKKKGERIKWSKRIRGRGAERRDEKWRKKRAVFEERKNVQSPDRWGYN